MPNKTTRRLWVIIFALICSVLIISVVLYGDFLKSVFNGRATEINNQITETSVVDVGEIVRNGKITIKEEIDATGKAHKKVRVISQKSSTILTNDERKAIINYLGQNNDGMTQEERKIINDYLEGIYTEKSLLDGQITISTFSGGSEGYENLQEKMKDRENEKNVLNKYFY